MLLGACVRGSFRPFGPSVRRRFVQKNFFPSQTVLAVEDKAKRVHIQGLCCPSLSFVINSTSVTVAICQGAAASPAYQLIENAMELCVYLCEDG